MQTNYEACRAGVKREEGGYSSDIWDAGNWSSGITGRGVFIGSNMGVGAPAADGFMHKVMTAAWMRSLPDSVHSAIFRSFWNQVAGDDMPDGLDYMLIDSGWNRGARTAVKMLQDVLGLDGKDGVAGPVTIKAVGMQGILHPFPAIRLDIPQLQRGLGLIDDGAIGAETRAALLALPPNEALIILLGARQAWDYCQLSNFAVYGKGWLLRVQRRVVRALLMARAAPAVA